MKKGRTHYTQNKYSACGKQGSGLNVTVDPK
jgi:hypothetical protein